MSNQAVSYGVDTAPESASWSNADRVAIMLVLLAVALCFAPTLGFTFVDWDDPDLVLNNPLIVAPGSVPLFEHVATPQVGYPTPVTVLSYRLEYALVGFAHPWVQHLVNVLFHLGSVSLVFAIARSLGVGTIGATLAAALAGLHPAVAEPVSWITGRKDVLALFFSLATIRLSLPLGTTPSRGRRVAMGLTFLLALGSKPVAVALAPMGVLLAIFRSPPIEGAARRLGRAISANLPELLATLAFLPLAYVSHRDFGGLREHEPLGEALRSAWYGLGAHLGIVLGIEAPCVQHIPAAMPPPLTPRFDLLPALVIGVFVLAFRTLDRRGRGLFAGALAWSVFAYLPSSGLVPMNRFIADSYVYPVLPGLGLALGLVVDHELVLSAGRLPRLRRGLVPAVLFGLGWLVVPASARFGSSEALWLDAAEQYPKYFRACRNWSIAVNQVDGPELGLAATDRCMARFGPERLERNRAVALFELGRVDEAAEWMALSLLRDPGDRKAPTALLVLGDRWLASWLSN